MSKQEHSPLPWKAVETLLRHVGSREVVDKNGLTVITVTRTEDAEIIVEACNNYERLKAENQRLRNRLEDILKESTFADKCDIQIVYEIAEDALQREGENK